jgi:putative ABC transport system permease protein
MRTLLDSLRQDFVYALRRLRKSPAFTVAAVSCLGIGVWLACVVTAVERGLYRPDLGFARPDRVIQVDVEGAFGGDYEGGRRVSRSVINGLRESRLFDAIGEYASHGARFPEEPVEKAATRLSSSMFAVFGIRPYLGRGFLPAEDSAGAGNVVMLSYDLWKGRYGADSGVIGRQIYLARAPAYTIVGVMPPGFDFPNRTSPRLYLAAGTNPTPFMEFNTVRTMLARLRDGVTIAQADSAARDLAYRNIAADREALVADWARIHQRYPLVSGPIAVHTSRYYAEPVGDTMDRLMALIIGCGIAVVLIACANVANLLLIRGESRRQEIAVRLALGASRSRIITQLVAESILVSVAGAALGFLLAFWHWRLLDSSFVLRNVLGRIDGWVALTASCLGVGLVVIFGLLPAFRTSGLRLEQVLRDARRAALGVTRLDGVLAKLVIGSTAATVVLLSCALLLGANARDELRNRRFDSTNVLAADLLIERRVPDGDVSRSATTILEEWTARTHARAAALAPMPLASVPMQGRTRVTPDGGTPVALGALESRAVTGGYFAALAIPLTAGRTFTDDESRRGGDIVIVGASLAKKVWGARNPVGSRARFTTDADSQGFFATIVGVAPDLVIGRGALQPMEMYRPFGSAPPRLTSLMLRYATAEQMRSAARLKTPNPEGMVLGEIMSLDDRARRRDASRYIVLGFSLFATAGLILVVVGLYGVIAFSVARSTHELGVRLALGATPRSIELLVTRQGIRLTLFGTLIGLILSVAAAQGLRAIVRDIDPADPRIIGVVIVIVAAISLAACWWPARRAAQLDPMESIRNRD